MSKQTRKNRTHTAVALAMAAMISLAAGTFAAGPSYTPEQLQTIDEMETQDVSPTPVTSPDPNAPDAMRPNTPEENASIGSGMNLDDLEQQ